MPPYKFFLMQMHHNRMIERDWEQTRSILAMQHNTAMGKKRNIKATQIMPLSFDRGTEYPDWTPEDANELIDKWPDIPSKN